MTPSSKALFAAKLGMIDSVKYYPGLIYGCDTFEYQLGGAEECIISNYDVMLNTPLEQGKWQFVIRYRIDGKAKITYGYMTEELLNNVDKSIIDIFLKKYLR